MSRIRGERGSYVMILCKYTSGFCSISIGSLDMYIEDVIWRNF